MLKDLRIKFGRNAVESHVRNELKTGKLMFASYFTAETTYFFTSDEDIFQRPFVYCSDIEGLIMLLAFLRDQEPEELARKIGVDNGQGHLQVKGDS